MLEALELEIPQSTIDTTINPVRGDEGREEGIAEDEGLKLSATDRAETLRLDQYGDRWALSLGRPTLRPVLRHLLPLMHGLQCPDSKQVKVKSQTHQS